MKQFINKKCIVRCNNAGVFFGTVKEISKDANGINVLMSNVRKIWYWDGACAVEQLAVNGCNNKSKITIMVEEMELMSAVQIIPCTEDAIKNLEGHKEWKR